MPQCPVCSAEINEDFGLVNCPSCSAALMIEMDGSVSVSGGGEEVLAPPAQQEEYVEQDDFIAEEPVFEEEPANEFDDFQSLMPPELPENSYVEEPVAEETYQEESYQEENFLEEEMVAEESAEAEEDDGYVEPTEPLEEPAPVREAHDLSDISEFANSTGGVSGGPFLYRITVSGIDSAELRKRVRSILSEEKFFWDALEIISKMRQGQIIMDNVPPIKAQVFISQIKALSLEIDWEQYEVHS